MSEEQKEPLSAKLVQDRYEAFRQAIAFASSEFAKMVSITPMQESVGDDKPPIPMVTPDMRDSSQHVARSLKLALLDAFVVSQDLMNFTPEAREAAIAANPPAVPQEEAEVPDA